MILLMYWKYAVIGVLVLVLTGTIAWAKVQGHRLAAAKEEVKTKEIVIDSMKEQIKAQNKAIEEWQKAASEQRRKVLNAEIKMVSMRKDFSKAIDNIIASPIPIEVIETECGIREDGSEWVQETWDAIWH